jgi:hypothetical protein
VLGGVNRHVFNWREGARGGRGQEGTEGRQAWRWQAQQEGAHTSGAQA